MFRLYVGFLIKCVSLNRFSSSTSETSVTASLRRHTNTLLLSSLHFPFVRFVFSIVFRFIHVLIVCNRMFNFVLCCPQCRWHYYCISFSFKATSLSCRREIDATIPLNRHTKEFHSHFVAFRHCDFSMEIIVFIAVCVPSFQLSRRRCSLDFTFHIDSNAF